MTKCKAVNVCTGEPGEAAHYGSSQLSTVHIHCRPARTRPTLPSLSSEHLLEFLHRKATHRLRGRLRLEYARLLGEGIDALACLRGRLVLQLHVEHTCKLERTR